MRLDLHSLLITALLACFTVGHSAHKHYHSLHVKRDQEARLGRDLGGG